jgi:hypothetical protein
MKLYRTQHLVRNPATGDSTPFTWQGTQADAAAKRKELKTAGCADVETKGVDVPTDKAGLLAWLNTNVTGTASGE